MTSAVEQHKSTWDHIDSMDWSQLCDVDWSDLSPDIAVDVHGVRSKTPMYIPAHGTVGIDPSTFYNPEIDHLTFVSTSPCTTLLVAKV